MCFEVRPSGTKVWGYRYRYAGKPSIISVAEYPATSLAEACAERERLSPGCVKREKRLIEKDMALVRDMPIVDITVGVAQVAGHDLAQLRLDGVVADHGVAVLAQEKGHAGWAAEHAQ
ncbi:Arm DNA-binding domain-containing protein [Thermomonas sp.]